MRTVIDLSDDFDDAPSLVAGATAGGAAGAAAPQWLVCSEPISVPVSDVKPSFPTVSVATADEVQALPGPVYITTHIVGRRYHSTAALDPPTAGGDRSYHFPLIAVREPV